MSGHSLKARMISTLRWLLANGPQAQQSAADDVARQILKERLATAEMLPSPYAGDRSKAIPHLRITDAGRDYVGGA